MWLDRFSGHSTPGGSPPPQNRSLSQSSRRPSHLGPGSASRPGFSPRSSSLNVSANFNSSTTSINSPRLPNGSSLRQEVVPPPDVTDPLKVLEKIVGKALHDADGTDDATEAARVLNKPKEFSEDVEFNGLGLHDFVYEEAQNRETEVSGFEDSPDQTAEEYEKDKDKFEDLHRSILACDDVLQSVEVSLTNFQKDLGTVSAEIETLQNRSTALNTKLENRKVVEKLLGPAVEEISIAPTIVKKISEGPVDQEWAKALEILERRSKAIDSKTKEPAEVLAVSDVKPLLQDLTNLAIERIRDFFVSQIKSLRSPNINAQIIQQRAFLAYKDIYGFLAKHHPQLGEEIAQAYGNTMRWYYLSHFTRYKQALEKIPLYTVDKNDALGADQNTSRGPVLASGKPQTAPSPLSLGRRIDILTRPTHTALPAHVAEDAKDPSYLETPFHAFATALVDNASFEYAFITAFFPTTSFASLSQMFNTIFSPTFALGHALTKQLIDPTYDCLSILLCVRINQHLAFELQRRKCPVADGYINGTNMLLWPRFQLAMDAHVESVKRTTAAFSSSARATLSLTSTRDDGKGSTAPHMLTQRFGQFLQGILALSSNDSTSNSGSAVSELAATGSDIEPVTRSLDRLRSEVEAFLNKAAKGLAQGRRERFLANNYSLILTIVADTGGSLAREQKEYFEDLREAVGGS